MSLYKREYQFGNYLIRLMERSRKDGSSSFRVEEKTKKMCAWWESMKISARRLMLLNLSPGNMGIPCLNDRFWSSHTRMISAAATGEEKAV